MIAAEGMGRNRLGKGIMLDGKVLYSLRFKNDPDHERVMAIIMPYAEQRVALVVSSLSLAETARRVQAWQGPEAAGLLIGEVWELMNIVHPGEEDLKSAAELLSQGVTITLEEAVVGAMARRLGCSIYGASPAYHLFHVPVIIDAGTVPTDRVDSNSADC